MTPIVVGKPVLQMLLVYFSTTILIFASDWFSGGAKIVPIMLSVFLLIPFFIWYRFYRKRVVLAQQMAETKRDTILLEVFGLFFLAMIVRLPSILLFGNVYEKTPLIYLVVLTIIFIKKESLWIYGFRTEKFGKALLIGLVYYLVFELSGFVFLNAMTVAYAGELFFKGYDPVPFLVIFPFMTFCVGVSEEGLFRGVMQTCLYRVYGEKMTVYTQAVWFGLWHFAWHVSPLNIVGMSWHMLSAFVIGLIFGYFYHVSRNLTPLILTHGLIDSVQYGFIPNPSFTSEGNQFLMVQLISVAVSITALAVSTKFLAERIRINK